MLVSFDESPNAVKVRYRTCTDRARSLGKAAAVACVETLRRLTALRLGCCAVITSLYCLHVFALEGLWSFKKLIAWRSQFCRFITGGAPQAVALHIRSDL